MGERQPVAFSFHRHDPDGMVELGSMRATDDEGSAYSEFAALHSYIWVNDSTQAMDLWFRIDAPVGGGLYPPGADPKSDVCYASAMLAC